MAGGESEPHVSDHEDTRIKFAAHEHPLYYVIAYHGIKWLCMGCHSEKTSQLIHTEAAVATILACVTISALWVHMPLGIGGA